MQLNILDKKKMKIHLELKHLNNEKPKQSNYMLHTPTYINQCVQLQNQRCGKT